MYQTVGTASGCPTHAGPDRHLLHQSQIHKIQNGIPQVFRLPSSNQSTLRIMPLQWLIVPSHSPLSMKCTLDGITSHIATNYGRIPHSGHIFSVPYTHITEDHLIGLHQHPIGLPEATQHACDVMSPDVCACPVLLCGQLHHLTPCRTSRSHVANTSCILLAIYSITVLVPRYHWIWVLCRTSMPQCY